MVAIADARLTAKDTVTDDSQNIFQNLILGKLDAQSKALEAQNTDIRGAIQNRTREKGETTDALRVDFVNRFEYLESSWYNAADEPTFYVGDGRDLPGTVEFAQAAQEQSNVEQVVIAEQPRKAAQKVPPTEVRMGELDEE